MSVAAIKMNHASVGETSAKMIAALEPRFAERASSAA
jgi:hypothetical protein